MDNQQNVTEGLEENNEYSNEPTKQKSETKFCKHCGQAIDVECVICPKCGKQVEELNTTMASQPNIVINNANTNTNMNTNANINNVGYIKSPKNKWVALALCFFLGVFGGHKFYEGKTGLGILYLCTCGLGGIGVLVDFIILLFKPNPYYV